MKTLMRNHSLGVVVGMLAALAAIGIPLPASRAAAANLDITPSISLDQTYDSNVFNTDRDEKGDFVLRATPALIFSLRMPETTLNLRTSLTSDTYYKYTEFNSINSAFALAVDATPIRITPRFSMVPSAHYVEARDSFRRNQLIPTGDPLIQPSIAAEIATQKTRDYGAALRMSYLVTPKTEFSLEGGFLKRVFLDNVTGGVDSRVISGDTTLTYRFTPLFSSGMFLSTASNTFGDGRDSRTMAGGVTGTWQFAQEYSLRARAGVTRARESGIGGGSDNTTVSPFGALTVEYRLRDLSVSIAGSVAQSGGGSFGLTTQRESIGLILSNQIAARWWTDLSGSYEQNRSLDDAVSEDLTSATGTAGIRHQVWEWATVRLSGTAFRQWSNGVIGTDLTRYSAFLGITLGKTYNIY